MSYRIGLASQERMEKTLAKKQNVEKIKQTLQHSSIEPLESATYLLEKNTAPLTQKQKAAQLLLRPGIDLVSLSAAIPSLKASLGEYSPEILEQAEIQIKYDVYIEKEKDLVQRMSQLEDLLIPDNFNYDHIASLSNEALQKFKKIKPRTLGQASRISGVNPSDIQILMVFMGR